MHSPARAPHRGPQEAILTLIFGELEERVAQLCVGALLLRLVNFILGGDEIGLVVLEHELQVAALLVNLGHGAVEDALLIASRSAWARTIE
jgi:hypothetical protein